MKGHMNGVDFGYNKGARSNFQLNFAPNLPTLIHFSSLVPSSVIERRRESRGSLPSPIRK